MSYSFTTGPLDLRRDPMSAILDAFERPAGEGYPSPADGQAQAGTLVEARNALYAAGETLRGGLIKALGPNVDTYQISVSGNANPGHQKREGWANDQVTVTVRVVRYAP